MELRPNTCRPIPGLILTQTHMAQINPCLQQGPQAEPHGFPEPAPALCTDPMQALLEGSNFLDSEKQSARCPDRSKPFEPQRFLAHPTNLGAASRSPINLSSRNSFFALLQTLPRESKGAPNMIPERFANARKNKNEKKEEKQRKKTPPKKRISDREIRKIRAFLQTQIEPRKVSPEEIASDRDQWPWSKRRCLST